MIQNKTAGIFVIGDEILSGRTEDLNSPFLIKELNGKGVEVKYCFTLPDDPNTIAHFAMNYSEDVSWVFTSGGIGPTPDDVTMVAFSLAFNVPLVSHTILARQIKKYYQEKCTPEHMKMAMVPEGTSLIQNAKTDLHALHFKNIYFLPGVPDFFTKVFLGIQDEFIGDLKPNREIDLVTDEGWITGSLEQTLALFPEIKIGSYPSFSKGTQKVKIVLEHKDEGYLDKAFNSLYEKVDAFVIK